MPKQETGENHGEETSEQKLEALPVNEREKLEKSWSALEKIKGPERENSKGVSIFKTEKGDEDLVRKQSEEIHNFLAGFFNEEENPGVKQIEIGISEGLIDNYIARDKEGKIASVLQTQTMETLSDEGNPEISLIVWFIAQSKDYKGGGFVSRDLFQKSFEDLLKKSKDELKPVKAIVAETVPEVEKLSNFYGGLKRVYGKDKDGKMFEVPFEDPPEDESTEGVPEHLMVRLLNGEETISTKNLLSLVDGIYSQYTKPAYFTPEAIKAFMDEDESVDIAQETANMYRQGYTGIVAEIREKLAKLLESTEGDLFFMTEKERKKSGIEE